MAHYEENKTFNVDDKQRENLKMIHKYVAIQTQIEELKAKAEEIAADFGVANPGEDIDDYV